MLLADMLCLTHKISDRLPQGDPWRLTSLSIHGTSLILLYAISSLSHAHDGSRRGTLTRLDHCTIYLLIAGTYTPFTLVTLRGPWGWSLFGVVWGLALLGILIDLLWKQDRRILPVVIYLIMGWLVVFAIKPLRILMDPMGFGLLVTGGLVYTLTLQPGISRIHVEIPNLLKIMKSLNPAVSTDFTIFLYFHALPPSNSLKFKYPYYKGIDLALYQPREIENQAFTAGRRAPLHSQ